VNDRAGPARNDGPEAVSPAFVDPAGLDEAELAGLPTQRRVYTVREGAQGLRLDAFLREQPDLDVSRAYVQRLIDAGLVLVNGSPSKPGYRVREGDVVEVDLPEPRPAELVPEDIPLDVVHEDEDVIVINKPRDLVVHPAAGHVSGTLVNALLKHCPDLAGINDVVRPGIVHRLDKDTTGLMVVAKSDLAFRDLSLQIRQRKVSRRYLALVHGNLPPDTGTVEAPIGRHPTDRKRMAVVERGSRRAVTHFVVKERFGVATLVEVTLETGRTHQIRVHFEAIGHPVVGDPVYGPQPPGLKLGNRRRGLGGQALHAYRLGFFHPRSKEWLLLEAPPPADFKALLEALRQDPGLRLFR